MLWSLNFSANGNAAGHKQGSETVSELTPWQKHKNVTLITNLEQFLLSITLNLIDTHTHTLKYTHAYVFCSILIFHPATLPEDRTKINYHNSVLDTQTHKKEAHK